MNPTINTATTIQQIPRKIFIIDYLNYKHTTPTTIVRAGAKLTLCEVPNPIIAYFQRPTKFKIVSYTPPV